MAYPGEIVQGSPDAPTHSGPTLRGIWKHTLNPLFLFYIIYIIYRKKIFKEVQTRIHSTGGAGGSCPDTSVGEGVSMPHRPLSRLRGGFLARSRPRFAAHSEHVIRGMFLGARLGLPDLSGGSGRDPPGGMGWRDIGKIRKSGQFFSAL